MTKAGITENSEHSAPKIDSSQPLSRSMEDTLALFRKIFRNDGTLRIRVIENEQDKRIRCAVVYVDGMIDRELIQNGVMRPVMTYEFPDGDRENPESLMEQIRTRVINISDVMVSVKLDELIGAVVGGKTVFLLDGYAGSLNINAHITSLFIKTSLCLYVSCQGISRVFNLESYRSVVLQMGLIMVYMADFIYKDITQMQYFAYHIYKVYALPFQLFIPLLLWITAEITARRAGAREEPSP